MRTIAIIGASADRSKFGNKAVRAYHQEGWRVYPVHPSEKTIEGLTAYPNVEAIPESRLDRVSLYLPPKLVMGVLEGIAKKRPGELWLNPGTESEEVMRRAEQLGLNVIEACSIVDIGVSPSAFP